MRRSGLGRYALCSCVAAALLAGCGGSQPPIGAPGAMPQSRTHATTACPCLYVANVLYGRVTVYPLGATGNVKPIQEITGPKTRLAHPHGIAVDGSGKIYVANLAPSSVTVYAAGATGNAKPIEIISGSKTELTTPLGIALDSANGDIYVSNGESGRSELGSITAYAAGSHGDVSPIGVIQGSKTRLYYPHYIAFDATRNIEVTNYNNTVTFYSARRTGNIAPVRIIAGIHTRIKDPIEVAVDSSLKTYIANAHGNSVAVYAPGASGNAAPVQYIHGGRTSLHIASGVAVDSDGNIYAGSGLFGNTSIITVYGPGSNGNVRPLGTIQGDNTGLDYPAGIAVH